MRVLIVEDEAPLAETVRHGLTEDSFVVEIVRNGGMLALHPLCGGLPPDLAWKYFRIVADEVMPAASGQAAGR